MTTSRELSAEIKKRELENCDYYTLVRRKEQLEKEEIQAIPYIMCIVLFGLIFTPLGGPMAAAALILHLHVWLLFKKPTIFVIYITVVIASAAIWA